MGPTAADQRVGLGENSCRAPLADTHHPCLGPGRGLPYSADRGKKSVNRYALDELKQQIPLLEYLSGDVVVGVDFECRLSSFLFFLPSLASPSLHTMVT